MSLRFRRRRVVLIVVIAVLIGLYLFNYYNISSDDQYDSVSDPSVMRKRRHPEDEPDTLTTTHEKRQPVTRREEIVDLNGKKVKKIDWHDYEYISTENARQGLGEHGVGVEPTSEYRANPRFSNLYQQNGFNAFISEIIPLNRSVNDIRHPLCKAKLYLANLPSVSIIIPIHDEHLITLLRSIHSILNRTPPELLVEIILVDDASGKDELRKPLDDAVNQLRKTRIIRLQKREGLIRTRMAGAREAKGDILIFFDSHIEVNTNWLPPLIEPIAVDYKTSVCPFIDIIKWENFAYIAQDEGARGAFDWQMFYKRLPLLPSKNGDPTEPFDDPVMAGGLFAISKEWFRELEGYDEGLDVWGGEQYEMSFKIWQCGGRLVDAPCSRVGHVYRQFNPHGGFSFGDYLSRNHKRVAAVWMDEYAEYIYKRNSRMRSIDPGDISKQIKLRKQLNCKPFKWFMENVAYDLPQYYPPVPLPPYATGEIRSKANPLCIDTKFSREQTSFGLNACLRDHRELSGEQGFELGWRQDLRPLGREYCFDVPRGGIRVPIILFPCHGMRGNQHFAYNPNTFQLKHIATGTCIDADLDSKALFMNACNPLSETQKWEFQSYNVTLIDKDLSKYF